MTKRKPWGYYTRHRGHESEDNTMMTQRRVETILRTWRAVRTIARARIERDGAFWASPIYPSVAAATPWIDAPAIVQQIKFEKTVRDGIEIITCENVMVEAWS